MNKPTPYTVAVFLENRGIRRTWEPLDSALDGDTVFLLADKPGVGETYVRWACMELNHDHHSFRVVTRTHKTIHIEGRGKIIVITPDVSEDYFRGYDPERCAFYLFRG